MIPFENTVPYDIIMGIFIFRSALCHEDNVLVSPAEGTSRHS